MKLSEMFDETVQYAMVGKLLAKGVRVELDYMEYKSDFTRWHSGDIFDIVHATGPGTNNFLVWYWRETGSGKIKDSIRIQHQQFNRLHLCKHKDHWKLSDRKPEPDDEAV